MLHVCNCDNDSNWNFMIEDHITPKPPKKPRRIFAKNFKCCVCGKQAEVFWPVVDPDIPSHAYCRPCVEKEQAKLLIMLNEKKHAQ